MTYDTRSVKVPAVNIPLVGLERTVTMPITFNVLEQIKGILNLPDSVDVKVPSSSTDYALCNLSGIPKDKPKDDVYGDLRVTVEEEQDEASINTTGTFNNNQSPIVLDNTVGLKIWPIYVPTKLNINVTFKAKDKTVLTSWVNTLKIKLAQDARSSVHDLEFRYVFPTQYYNLIKHIWELQEQVAPYSRTLPDYLQYINKGNLLFTTDVEAINLDLLVKENQHRVIGSYDFILPDKIEYDKESGKWVTEFSYSVMYSKPIGMHAEYPVMVHQQLLSNEYLVNYISINDVDHHVLPSSNEMSSTRLFESYMVDMYYRDRKPLKVPLVDDYNYSSSNPFTRPLVGALCQITEDDKRSLLNLNDLDFIRLDPELLNWIKSVEKDYVTRLMASFIYIELLENGIKSKVPLLVDSDLNVIAERDLNLRSVYRVVISIITECNIVNSRALTSFGDYTKDIIKEELDNDKGYSPIYGDMFNRDKTQDDCFTRSGILKTVQVTDMVMLDMDSFLKQIK